MKQPKHAVTSDYPAGITDRSVCYFLFPEGLGELIYALKEENGTFLSHKTKKLHLGGHHMAVSQFRED